MKDFLGISVGMANWSLLPGYAKCGIEAVEISLPDKPLTELIPFARGAAALAGESGMQVWSVHLPFSRRLDISNPDDEGRENALAELYRTIDLAREVGAGTLVVHGSSEPNEDSSRPARMAACAESLSRLQAYAGEMRLAVENLPRTCIGRTGQEVALLSQSCAGVCFDVNHLLIEDHDAFLDAAGKRVITTHLSDYDGIDERHWLPGAGVVPFKRVRERLLGMGYDGPFLFELRLGGDGKPYPPEDVVKAWQKAIS